jgi:heme-degrading monooxygenase HmoA
MYMRLTQLKVKPEGIPNLGDAYRDHVIPRLQGIPGCRCANLLQNRSHPETVISLTLWDSAENAESYQRSKEFSEIMDDVEPYLAESTEWKIRLSEDLELEYAPVVEEPVVASYRIAARSNHGTSPFGTGKMYTRIVSHNVQPGRIDEFEQIYREEILPVLHNTDGCSYAYLMQGAKSKNEMISITIWDSQEAAEQYESSGQYQACLSKLRHTFSQLYQWKMALERDRDVQVKTSEDVSLAHYTVVAGKCFE